MTQSGVFPIMGPRKPFRTWNPKIKIFWRERKRCAWVFLSWFWFFSERRSHPSSLPSQSIIGLQCHWCLSTASSLLQPLLSSSSFHTCPAVSVSALTRRLLYARETVRSRSLLLCLFTRVSACVYPWLILFFRGCPLLLAITLPHAFFATLERQWNKIYAEKETLNVKSPSNWCQSTIN